MFRPDDKTVAALRELIRKLPDPSGKQLEAELAEALGLRKPDLTGVLLLAAALAEPQVPLSASLAAACCRAFAARIAAEHPGRSIELRVPPYTAVQVGFDHGPSHRRGTPPNVVEISPQRFIALCLGNATWEQTELHASGAQAGAISAVFPLLG